MAAIPPIPFNNLKTKTTMTGLTQDQEQEVNRDKKVQDYLNLKQTVVDSYPPLLIKQGKLGTYLDELNQLIPGKIPTTKGITTTKSGQKKEVGTFYEGVCGVCRAYCLEKGDLALADNFKITKAKIVDLPDNDVLPLIEGLNKMITNNLIPEPDFADYAIDANTLTTGYDLAKDFNKSIGLAPAVDANKTSTSDAIEEKITQLKTTIDSIELLVRNFITSNKDFYNGFQAVNKIDDIGVHHTGIRGEVESANGQIKQATITCVQLNKTTTTDLLGHYELIKMKPGTYEFTCAHPDFTTQTRVIKVKRGRIIEVDWKL